MYECDFGITLASLLTREGDFGATLGLIRGDFPHMRVTWGNFGVTLDYFWYLGGALGALWLHFGVNLGI